MAKQVGITGGIGSGKSVVCRILACLGVPVYEADSRSKYLLVHDEQLREHIKVEFGEAAYLPDGSVNRAYLADQTFHAPERLQRLNQLTHPRVKRDYESWYAHQKAVYVVKEAALLFEAGSDVDLDYIVVVTAPETVRLARVLARDLHRSEKAVRDIMSRQWPDDKKIAKADAVLNNDGSTLLIPQVLELHRRFVS
jgi:dephospho-CoA kinase